MSAKKSVLEKLKDTELEEYIKKGNRFVPEANKYALEILKSRGRIFAPEELNRFNLMIAEKTVNTETIIHPNHTKSAKLIYVSGAMGIVNALLSPEISGTGAGLFTGILTLAIIFGIGYLISKGYNGVKYILLTLMILGLFAMPLILLNFLNNPIVGSINILQAVVQIWALILLFKIPKKTKL